MNIKQLIARTTFGTPLYRFAEETMGPNALSVGTSFVILAYALSVDGLTKLDFLIRPFWLLGCVFLLVSVIALVISILVRNHLRREGRAIPLAVKVSYFVSIFLYFINFAVILAASIGS